MADSQLLQFSFKMFCLCYIWLPNCSKLPKTRNYVLSFLGNPWDTHRPWVWSARLLNLTPTASPALMKPSFPRTPYPLWPFQGVPIYSLTPHVPEDQWMWLLPALFLIAASRIVLPHSLEKSHVLLKNVSFCCSILSLFSSYLRIALHIPSFVNICSTWFTSSSPLQVLLSVTQENTPASPKLTSCG